MHLLTRPPTESHPSVQFSFVLDLEVCLRTSVSVSRLARESRQKQLRVIEELQKSQNLLLTEEHFSELMDRLADKIVEGKLSLPISPQTILQIQASR